LDVINAEAVGVGLGIVDAEDEELIVCIVVVAWFVAIDVVCWSGDWLFINNWRS
jgi:hypothetical protein